MVLINYMSPAVKDALMNGVEAQTVPDNVETAEDMLFPDSAEDLAIDAEPVDSELKALFNAIPSWVEEKVSAGMGQADPRVQSLIKYWTLGEGGTAKVKWGVPGDGKRCIRYMTKYIGPNRAPGFCQTLHKKMVGTNMGSGPGEKSGDGGMEGADRRTIEPKKDDKNKEFNSKHPRNADGTFAYKEDSGEGEVGKGTKDKGIGASSKKPDGEIHGRVSAAQALLVKEGFLKSTDGHKGVAVDGWFGKATEKAVAAYQKKNKLKVTGKIDAATQKAMGGLGAKKSSAKKTAAKRAFKNPMKSRAAKKPVAKKTAAKKPAAKVPTDKNKVPTKNPTGSKLKESWEDGSGVYEDGTTYDPDTGTFRKKRPAPTNAGMKSEDGFVHMEMKDLQGFLDDAGVKMDDVPGVIERKVVRHVRTTAGVRRFKKPIGTVIGSNGAALKNILEVDSEYDGWKAYKRKGSKDTMYVGKDAGKYVVTDSNDVVKYDASGEEDALKWLDKPVRQTGTFHNGPSSANSSNPNATGNRRAGNVTQNRIQNAAAMYGTGSRQHLAAIERFSGK